MKNRKLICAVLIVVCLVIFVGYRIVDKAATDSASPEISISGELQLSVLDEKEAMLTGVSATDNKDGDVTGSLVIEGVKVLDSDGTVSITYAAFDSAGNVAKAERIAQYTDYVSPRFTLRAPLVFSSSNFDVLSIVGAEDLFDGDIKHRVRVNPLEDMSSATVGEHEVQFRVSNSLGDTSELILPVEVIAAGKYNANLTLKSYIVYLPVGADFNEKSYLNEFICYGDAVSLNGGVPTGYRFITEGRVDTETPGVYTVSYEVTYNQVYTGYSKLIVVVEG